MAGRWRIWGAPQVEVPQYVQELLQPHTPDEVVEALCAYHNLQREQVTWDPSSSTDGAEASSR